MLLYSTHSTLFYSIVLYSTLLFPSLVYFTLFYSSLVCSALYSTLFDASRLCFTLFYTSLLFSTLPYSTLLCSSLSCLKTLQLGNFLSKFLLISSSNTRICFHLFAKLATWIPVEHSLLHDILLESVQLGNVGNTMEAKPDSISTQPASCMRLQLAEPMVGHPSLKSSRLCTCWFLST